MWNGQKTCSQNPSQFLIWKNTSYKKQTGENKPLMIKWKALTPVLYAASQNQDVQYDCKMIAWLWQCLMSCASLLPKQCVIPFHDVTTNGKHYTQILTSPCFLWIVSHFHLCCFSFIRQYSIKQIGTALQILGIFHQSGIYIISSSKQIIPLCVTE